MLLVDTGMTGATGNYYAGLHEFADMAFLLHYLRESDEFVDVGANVGTYSILAAGVCGARTRAIEPLPPTFARLRANVRLNNLEERVEVLNVGLAAKPGILRFTESLDTVNHVLAAEETSVATGADVTVTTLDSVVADRPPRLVKIDVEGYETEVFAGAKATLARPELRAVIVELNGSGRRYGFDDADLKHRIEAAGFHSYTYEPYGRALRPSSGKSTEGNTLYIRDAAEVETRVRGARAVKVFGVTI